MIGAFRNAYWEREAGECRLRLILPLLYDHRPRCERDRSHRLVGLSHLLTWSSDVSDSKEFRGNSIAAYSCFGPGACEKWDGNSAEGHRNALSEGLPPGEDVAEAGLIVGARSEIICGV